MGETIALVILFLLMGALAALLLLFVGVPLGLWVSLRRWPLMRVLVLISYLLVLAAVSVREYRAVHGETEPAWFGAIQR